MHQSFFASALCLTLITTCANARAHERLPEVGIQVQNAHAVQQRSTEVSGVLDWVARLFRKDVTKRQTSSGICYEDSYYIFIQNQTNGQGFCRFYMDYPNQTATVDYTPTSTFYSLTTSMATATKNIYTTPKTTTTVTQTVTGGKKAKREANAQITARADANQMMIDNTFNMFRRQQGMASSDNSSSSSTIETASSLSSMSSAFSSACDCMNYVGSTVATETFTDEAIVVTREAFTRATTTVTKVHYAQANVATATVTTRASPASSANSVTISATASTSTGPATPTSPPFTCPDDNGEVISQMIDAQRFDYQVNCSIELTSPIFYDVLTYPTFGQCVSACSKADANFTSAVCQGVSYLQVPDKNGYDCYLFTSGNASVAMKGVDSAILLRIVRGVSSANEVGTTTDAGFATETPTQPPGQLSSDFSVMMGNSTSSMPLITPGPSVPISGHLVNGATTIYSTYVSDGTTYSSGTAFATNITSAGGWYYTSYTSFTLQWAASTTEYAITPEQTAVSQVNSSASNQYGDTQGGYSAISWQNSTSYNSTGEYTTSVITNQTYAANGTEISSSATTAYYSHVTGFASSASGSAANGSIASASAETTSMFSTSTQTVIYSSGGAGGASGVEASGAISTPAPTTSATVIVNSAGFAASSGIALSGLNGGASGAGNGSVIPGQTSTNIIAQSGGFGSAASTAASGVVTSAPASTSVVSVDVNSSGFAGGTGVAASGAVTTPPAANSTEVIVITNSTGLASSAMVVASGAITPLPSSTSEVLVGLNSTGYAFSSGIAAPGLFTSLPASTSEVTVIVNSTNLGSASGFAASASVTTIPASTSMTVILSTGGTGFVSAIVASGSPMGTGGMSGTAASGVFPSPSSPVTTPEAPRSGSASPSTSLNMTTPAGTSPVSTSGLPRSGSASPPSSGNSTTPVGTSPVSSEVPPSESASPSTSLNITTPAGTSPVPTSGLPRSGTASPPASENGTTPAGTSPVTTSGAPRSGTAAPPMIPPGTAPLGTGLTGYSSLASSTGELRSGTGSPPLSTGVVPPGTAPLGTGPSPYTTPAPSGTAPTAYETPGGNRTGEYSPSGSLVTAPSGPVSTPGGNRSGSLAPPIATAPSQYLPSNETAPAPTGTVPPGLPLYHHGPLISVSAPSSGVPSFMTNDTSPPSTGSPFPSTSGDLRSGSQIPSVPLQTAPASSGSPLPSYNGTTGSAPTAPPSYSSPTALLSCTNATLATTTMFVTTTEYGCYSSCPVIPAYPSYPRYPGGWPQPFEQGPHGSPLQTGT